MNEKINGILTSFASLITNSKEVDSSSVTLYLDQIAKELDLLHIYVLEATGTRNNYIYPYISTGPYSKIKFFNLIVFQDEESFNLVNIFNTHNNICVFDDDLSASKKGVAKGNLAYGFIEDNSCIGFISFQHKEGEEDKPWTDEEKEIITRLGYIFKPLILERQIHDKLAYEKNISKCSVGLFWYYPKLKLVIVPSSTMEKFDIKDFVFRNSPDSFANALANDKGVEQVIQTFNSISKDNISSYATFVSKKDNDVFDHLTLTINRFDDEKNPLEVMGMIEEISHEQKEYEEKTEILKRYENFKKTISDDNRVEYYANLLNHKVTLFKADDVFQECFAENSTYEDLIEDICTKFVEKESQDSFRKILSNDYISSNLGKNNRSISITSNFNIDGETRRLETTVVLNSTSIYNYIKDVMIFVRDVTYTEALNYDKLTGLLTMSHFLSILRDDQARIKEDNLNVNRAIIYFDVAQFKLFNLQYGVAAGDEALKKLANILTDEYKDETISRFSDDHFVVLDTSDKVLEKVENVYKTLDKVFTNFKLNVKTGIYKLQTTVDAAIAVDYAQLACQEVKNDPRQNYCIYDDNLRVKVERKKYVIDHIDEAIEKKWIKVYYQPVVSTKNLTLAAMEALTRWVDPVYGFLSPADFIQALEERNLIYKLDMYVIDEIGRRLRDEIDNGHKVVPISFNLSRNDFLSCRPFEETEKVVKKYNLDRKLISVEITESVTMDDPGLINKAVNQFREAGYEVWMDDFGSGYSSLNVLKDFNFDEIKIDMAFLRTFNEKSKTIVTYMISMAKTLNIRTLTEGVETKEHVDFLTQAGCERIQGYYFSKPLPYEELIKTLKEKNIIID